MTETERERRREKTVMCVYDVVLLEGQLLSASLSTSATASAPSYERTGPL